MNFAAIGQALSRSMLVLKKNSPHILFGAGVVGAAGATVLACRSTLKVSEVLDEIQHDVEQVKGMESLVERESSSYSLDEYRKDTVYVYAKGAVKLGKLYAPALILGGVSIAAIAGSHIQLTKRNNALMVAYAAVAKAYDEYRDRVRDRLGPEEELDIYRGTKTEKLEDGTEVKVLDESGRSPYSRCFDEQSENFEKDAEYNRFFISCQQSWANERLRSKGHVFLNEVYESLGLDHTTAGSVVGWVWDGDGDNYIDFGLYSAVNAGWINSPEPRLWLDFNVDGVIYDKI